MEWGTWAEWANVGLTLLTVAAAVLVIRPTIKNADAASVQARTASEQLRAYIDDMRLEREQASRNRAARVLVMWTHDRQQNNEMVLLADNPTGQPMRELKVLAKGKRGEYRLQWETLPQGQWRARWNFDAVNGGQPFGWCKPAEANRFSPSESREWKILEFSFKDPDDVRWTWRPDSGLTREVGDLAAN